VVLLLREPNETGINGLILDSLSTTTSPFTTVFFVSVRV